MKRAGLVGYATVVTLIVLGSIAVAAPSFRAALHAPPSAAGSSGSGGESGPVGESGPTEAPALGAGDAEGRPDFTACRGLTGLDKAICRHEALLVVHPDSGGMQHSLERLLEERAEHEAKPQSRAPGSDGQPGGGHGGNPHGSDGSEEGLGGGPGNGNGQGQANGNGKDDAED